MIELPETYVLADQLNEACKGKTITNAEANSSPHSFAWYTGDPAEYGVKLTGKTVTAANPGTGYSCGGNTELICGDMLLVMSTPIKYHAPGDKLPPKHQLLLAFDDGSHLTCTVQMWGVMLCLPTERQDWPDGFTVRKSPTPLEDAFDEAYFNGLWSGVKKSISVKAFLATEQRIPGLGNGVLQDILFNVGVNPRVKLNALTEKDRENLFRSVKETLAAMTLQGGRDTERDLYGCPGGYQTILSAKTLNNPCPSCGAKIKREAYMGGNIYYCPVCQPL
ncbi:MAG: endonuclease VIII [Oscillospiraceae bacterium]|jgi:formamidopyrimidine-DNA glycosylase|nr:endonuclease VIII [Oscillospiraceae bacterium]